MKFLNGEKKRRQNQENRMANVINSKIKTNDNENRKEKNI